MPFDFTVFKGSPDGAIHEGSTRRPDLARDEVYVDVSHSGVCGTDAHFRWVDMALGHEGVGVVRAVGPEVKTVKM